MGNKLILKTNFIDDIVTLLLEEDIMRDYSVVIGIKEENGMFVVDETQKIEII